MKLEDIKIGDKLKIVGRTGGCSVGDKKCFECSPFDKGIVVLDTNDGNDEGKFVHGIDINAEKYEVGRGDHCNFLHTDLEPFHTTWKERYEK